MIETERPAPGRGVGAILLAAFWVTGLTSLTAEVILSRILMYVFGASHWATATVLAAYMAGLSLGAYVFGRRSARLRRPASAYAILELLVALYYVLVPLAYPPFREMVVALMRSLGPDAVSVSILRFSLAAAFVVVPTVLVGGTLPVLTSAWAGNDAIARRLPLLYATNTAGAAAGALLSSYVLIPRFGLDGTLAFCATANVVVAGIVLLIGERLFPSRGGGGLELAASPVEAGAAAPDPARRTGNDAVALAFLQGVLAFALEVVWTHLVGTVIGPTVHGFSIMLTAVLLGIALGSALQSRLWRRSLEPSTVFASAQCALAAWLVLSLPLWDRFPDLVNSAVVAKAQWTFGEREGLRLLYAFALLLPAALCLGLGLPALTASAARSRTEADPGRLVGRVFAANTIGAIAGALACGFWLLGRVPSSRILMAASVCALVLGAIALRGSGLGRRRWVAVGAVGLLIAGMAVAWPGWDLARLTAGSHWYWKRWPDSNAPSSLVFFAEDAQVGFVTVERSGQGMTSMKTNGKYEGSDAIGEFQDYLAVIAALYTRARDRAFVLGLGPGRIVGLLHDLPFERIEVAEFSPSIIRAARDHFPSLVGDALQDERHVHLVIDDGRNRLQLGREPLDLVLVAPTAAAFAGSGNIYNGDFFKIVRSRLAPEGVFALWVQLHHLDPRVFQIVLASLREVFPHVHVYQWPQVGQCYLVASPSPLYIDTKAALAEPSPRLRSALRPGGMRFLLEIASWSVLTTEAELDRVADRRLTRRYRDLDPGFEYQAAIGLTSVEPPLDLQRFSDGGLPEMKPPPPPGWVAGLSGLRLAQGRAYGEAMVELRRSESALGAGFWQQHLADLATKAGRP